MAGRPEKDKTAFVVHGRSVSTIKGTAHAGAAITKELLSKKEKQGHNLFYQLLSAGTIAYPPTISSEIKSADNDQLDMDALSNPEVEPESELEGELEPEPEVEPEGELEADSEPESAPEAAPDDNSSHKNRFGAKRK